MRLHRILRFPSPLPIGMLLFAAAPAPGANYRAANATELRSLSDKLVALDCKINFDDNAMFRHKDLKELRDLSEEDPLEVEASKFALNYIKLDGSIACMVNGAGLAMATMDIIQYAGERRRISWMLVEARIRSRLRMRLGFC